MSDKVDDTIEVKVGQIWSVDGEGYRVTHIPDEGAITLLPVKYGATNCLVIFWKKYILRSYINDKTFLVEDVP